MRFAQLSHQGIVSAIRDTAAGSPGVHEGWIWSLAESPDHGVHFSMIALAPDAPDPPIGDRYDGESCKFVPHEPWLRERLGMLDDEIGALGAAARRANANHARLSAEALTDPDEIADAARLAEETRGALEQAQAARNAHVARMKSALAT